MAAVAETDLDVRHDGASVGTIRFGATESTAAFIAASETILEPGGLLEVTAPASPDATLADLAITLAGALVSVP